jgi:hypothetical protein
VARCHLVVNEQVRGLAANTHASLQDAWSIADAVGEDYVLGLPDDIVVAHDALRLAAWMRDEFRGNRDVIFTTLWNSQPCGPEDFNRVFLSPGFRCQGWGTWRDRYEEDWAPSWHPNPNEWDRYVSKDVMRGRLQAVPYLSRVRHIGHAGGRHSHPDGLPWPQDEPGTFAGDVAVPLVGFWC